jgi:drug/metabolite transporter (DMT)-like permease
LTGLLHRLRAVNPAILAVLLAATLWGTLGVAYELIDRNVETDRLTIVTLRAVGATVILVVWWAIRDRSVFQVTRRDLPVFVLMGLVSVTIFYIILIYAFLYSSVAVATLLLYMAPAIVTIGAAVFLDERLTPSKLLALGISIAGCGLVVEITNPDAVSGNVKGIVFGLGSAICYGSYSLLAKPVLARYRAHTVQTVHMIFGSAALLAVKLVVSPGAWPSLWQTILLAVFLGTLISIAPVALYTYGLNVLPSSEASILATWEPVVAVVLAALILDERLGLIQTIGAGCVVCAVILLGRASASRTSPIQT